MVLCVGWVGRGARYPTACRRTIGGFCLAQPTPTVCAGVRASQRRIRAAKTRSPTALPSGSAYLLLGLAQQACSRDHDPGDECGHAGKQQDVVQESGHGNLPRAESPSAAIGHLSTVAETWQRNVPNGRESCRFRRENGFKTGLINEKLPRYPRYTHFRTIFFQLVSRMLPAEISHREGRHHGGRIQRSAAP